MNSNILDGDSGRQAGRNVPGQTVPGVRPRTSNRSLLTIIGFAAVAAITWLATCPAYPYDDNAGIGRVGGDSSPWFSADGVPQQSGGTAEDGSDSTGRIEVRSRDDGGDAPHTSDGPSDQEKPGTDGDRDADDGGRSDETPALAFEPEPLVVTAGHIPTVFDQVNRSVEVITRDDLDDLPVHSLQDVLEYALGVDVRRRGPHGVQGDVGVRGGTFEQTLVMVDGFKVSDPQTGHHNLDLPFALADIERIELLRGPGSRVHGPGAFSGVINIITREATGTGVSVAGAMGDHSFSEGEASVSFPALGVANRLSASRSESAGYTENTDFAIHNLAWNASIPAGDERVHLTLGHTQKEFGANGFYSASFPGQWEATETTFVGMRGNFELGGVKVEPRVYWRRHDDEFILDRERPDWYRNLHTTDIFGTEFRSTFESRFGVTALGGELGREEIESSNLGDHDRTRGGLFIEHRTQAGDRLTLSGGAFAYHYSDWGWEIWPGLDAGFRLDEQASLYASVERSFRVPTYTELYYESPANVGNPDLQPEEAWTYEGGMRWDAGPLAGSAALFRREGKNLIDWSRAAEDDPWQVRNVAEMDTTGVELTVTLLPRQIRETSPVSRVRVSFAWLDPDRAEHHLESRYVFNHLERQLILDLGHDWSFVGRSGGRLGDILGRLNQSWQLRSEDRAGDESTLLLDTRLAWRASLDQRSLLSRMEFFVEGTNLFDTEYFEAGALPMPGRWIIGGIKIGFGD